MVTVTHKMVVTQKLEGRCTSHARTDIAVRDRSMVIDEPLERGGTNQGLTPTETLMASLIGCTNVITHRVAQRNGVDIKSMSIRLEAQFDRRGVTLQEEIERPFTSVTLYIHLQTDADAVAVERVQRELAMFCPVSKVFRNAGIELKEVWSVNCLAMSAKSPSLSANATVPDILKMSPEAGKAVLEMHEAIMRRLPLSRRANAS